ncbi:MAG: hypothetical protein NUW01_09750, partial [Gemmatimonadaceae bacterium]|nr:hypothetical protein [Gemmatimonadaceae bacterium]
VQVAGTQMVAANSDAIAGAYIAQTITASSFSSVTNYGIYVASPGGAGAGVLNNYGLYVDSQIRGSNNWSVWTGTAQSHFGGAVDASSTLAVVGAATFSSASNTFSAMPASSAGLTTGMLYSSANANGQLVICIV